MEKHHVQFTLRSLFLLQLIVAVILILAKVAPRSAVEIITLTFACAYALWNRRHAENSGGDQSDSTRVPVWVRLFGVAAGVTSGFIIAVLIALFTGQVHTLDAALWYGRLGAMIGGVLGIAFPRVSLSIAMLFA